MTENIGVKLKEWWRRTRWQVYAPVYDLMARPMEKGRKRAVERLDLEPGDDILILGCGTGLDLKYLPDKVSMTAVDIVPEMIERTEKRAEELETEVETHIGDARSLKFEDDSFDAVLLHLILSVVPGPEKVASETERVLKPDGRVSIYDKFIPEGEEPSLFRRAFNPLARFLFSDLTRQLEPIFSGTGLEIETQEKFLGGVYTATTASFPDGD